MQRQRNYAARRINSYTLDRWTYEQLSDADLVFVPPVKQLVRELQSANKWASAIALQSVSAALETDAANEHGSTGSEHQNAPSH